jgi:hypothetical protein
MNATQINNLIESGATDNVRQKLKRMGIGERLRTLSKCIPNVDQSGRSLMFFRENFAKEIGAILMAEDDLSKAELLFRAEKAYSKEQAKNFS